MSEYIKDLLIIAKNGDSDAVNQILNKYKHLVSAISRKYYLLGGDREDLFQEGWFGFIDALHSFDENKNDNFKKYAILLIERQMLDVIRKANTNKNQVLSSSMLVDNDDVLSSEATLEDDMIVYENSKMLIEEMETTLSKKEKEVFEYYLQGYGYQDIAKMLNATPKSIDNTLTRVKNKLKSLRERL